MVCDQNWVNGVVDSTSTASDPTATHSAASHGLLHRLFTTREWHWCFPDILWFWWEWDLNFLPILLSLWLPLICLVLIIHISLFHPNSSLLLFTSLSSDASVPQEKVENKWKQHSVRWWEGSSAASDTTSPSCRPHGVCWRRRQILGALLSWGCQSVQSTEDDSVVSGSVSAGWNRVHSYRNRQCYCWLVHLDWWGIQGETAREISLFFPIWAVTVTVKGQNSFFFFEFKESRLSRIRHEITFCLSNKELYFLSKQWVL